MSSDVRIFLRFSTTSKPLASIKYYSSLSFEKMKYLTQHEAQNIDVELMGPKYQFSIDQLMELAGYSVACAVDHELKTEAGARVLICVGPGNNGGDGLVAARHLKLFGHHPSILYPKRPPKDIYQRLLVQSRQMDVPILENSEELSANRIKEKYDFIIDALFGFSFHGTPRPPFDQILAEITKSGVRICSIDIPSGWDVEKGDVSGLNFSPYMLVSLTSPKLCAKLFDGVHYIGGRFVPPGLEKSFQLELPVFDGANPFVKLT